MREIWPEAMGSENMRQLRQRGSALYRQRTEAIESMLTDEQRREYQQILADLDRERQKISEQKRQLAALTLPSK